MYRKIEVSLRTLAIVFLLAFGVFSPTAATATDNNNCNADGGHAHISMGDGVASEALGTVTFTLTCHPCGKVNAETWWSTTDGTATSPEDFTAITGHKIVVGTTSADTQTYDIVVTLNNETEFEPDETFTIGLGGSGMQANPSVGPPCLIQDDVTGTGTIENDDPPNEPPTANAGGPYFGSEGSAIALDSTLR